MSTEIIEPRPPIHPRPGVVKTLGILNIVFSVASGICILSSLYFTVAMAAASVPAAAVPNVKTNTVQVEVTTPPTPKPGTPMVSTINPFVGMNEPKFLAFSYLENGTSLLFGGLMFATGVGLLNLKRWAARGWAYLAWARIALLVLLWGYFIVGVAPSLSQAMARNVVEMIRQQNKGQAQIPNVAEITQVYSIMCLVVAVGTIILSALYPAVSLWLLSRPGVKAALVDGIAKEPGHP